MKLDRFLLYFDRFLLYFITGLSIGTLISLDRISINHKEEIEILQQPEQVEVFQDYDNFLNTMANEPKEE